MFAFKVREVLFEAETKLGPIEVLINNAGNSVQVFAEAVAVHH